MAGRLFDGVPGAVRPRHVAVDRSHNEQIARTRENRGAPEPLTAEMIGDGRSGWRSGEHFQELWCPDG